MKEMPNTWTYIRADALFADLIPEIRNYKRKILGSHTNGTPVEFSKQEKETINKALKQIPSLNPWRYIKAEKFFQDFLPDLKNFKKKIVGRNTRGNPISFTEKETQDIINAIEKLISNFQIK